MPATASRPPGRRCSARSADWTAAGRRNPLGWDDPITENPAVGATEVWEIYNFTADAHPIHIHEVQFEVVNRQPFGTAPARPPETWETASRTPSSPTRARSPGSRRSFDRPGLYVWHCHIVEHEDNEMMRPYRIGP